MKTRVSRWGNSLAVRIPSEMARAAGVRAGSVVEIASRRDGIVMRRRTRRYSLAELLSRVTPSNCHGGEWDEVAVGREGL